MRLSVRERTLCCEQAACDPYELFVMDRPHPSPRGVQLTSCGVQAWGRLDEGFNTGSPTREFKDSVPLEGVDDLFDTQIRQALQAEQRAHDGKGSEIREPGRGP